MRRTTWVLAAAAVLVVVAVTGGVVLMSGAATGPGHAAVAGEHCAGGEEDALPDGLPAWDPDLPGAIGRLAVLCDQPAGHIPGCPRPAM